MEAYWIKEQNRLLKMHYDAFLNQMEFWFANIVIRLNEYQKHIDSIRANRRTLLFY